MEPHPGRPVLRPVEMPFDWRATPLADPDWTASDLTPELLEAYRDLTGEQRLRIACEMSDEMRRRELARIRAEQPASREWQVKAEYLRRVFHPDPLPPASKPGYARVAIFRAGTEAAPGRVDEWT